MSLQEARQGVVRGIETPDELEQYKRNQLIEYSEWVAAQDIYAGTALAFREGDPVPSSTVKAQAFDKNGLVKPAKPAASAKAEPKATK